MTEEPVDRLRETTVRSEAIYDGRIVSLRIDEVELPDGGRSQREIVSHPGAVAAVPLTDAGDVLLVRQWRHPAGKALVEIPAGTREPDECIEDTLRRELVEEIGYSAGRIEHLAEIYTAPGYTSELISVYLARQLLPAEGEADFDEKIEVVQLPLTEAIDLCFNGGIRDGKSVAGLLLVARLLDI